MITDQELATTAITMSYELEPAGHIVGDLNGLVAEFCERFVGAFYPRTVSRKANVVITELFTNAVNHNADPASRISFGLSLDGDELSVSVSNAASEESIQLVRTTIDRVAAADDPRGVLARTIRDRRDEGQPGGLGLIRLMVENRFRLHASAKENVLTVQASFPLGGAK